MKIIYNNWQMTLIDIIEDIRIKMIEVVYEEL